MDLYRDENGRVFVRVVDYKTGKHDFSLDEVRSGMDIQLVLYLYALLAADPTLRAAGAHYLFASTESGHTEIKRSGFFLEEADVLDAADGGAGYTKKLEKQSAEEIAALGEEMNNTVRKIAERILAGEAEKTPSEEACAFCPVRDNCAKAYRK